MGTEQNNERKAGEDQATTAGATRREAIKKAAGAAAVAGTVWAAPRVDGFSLVPAYASAATFTPLAATGGNLVVDAVVGGQNYRFHTFTTGGVFSVTSIGTLGTGDFIEALLVGGGGGGSTGGGGAGRFLQTPAITLGSTGPYGVTIGFGGAAGNGTFWAGGSTYNPFSGGDGGESIIEDPALTPIAGALGGGGGGSVPWPVAGSADLTYARGRDGGSGGGAGFNNIESTKGLPTVVALSNVPGGIASAGASGNAGGLARRNNASFVGTVVPQAGGGGGAGGAGIQAFNRGNVSTSTGSDGGVGLSSLAFTGTNTFYAGGGAGANPTGTTQPVGGSGIGGNGFRSTTVPATAGAANTGSGGGGGRVTGTPTTATVQGAQPGGSGIVIIRYPIA